MNEEIDTEEATYIFRPGENDMKQQYPELKKEVAFKNLTNAELKFVWYYANKTSPFHQMAIDKRLHKAWSAAGFDPEKTKERKLKTKNTWPELIESAMKKMEEYNPNLRFQANMAIATIFDNMKLLIAIPQQDLLKREAQQQKQYIDMVTNINKEMPGIIKKLEEGYGVTTEIVKTKKVKETRIADAVPTEQTYNL
jgi:hypothetical protein